VKATDLKTKEDYVFNEYSKVKQRKLPEHKKLVGEAMLSDDYFIVGCQTRYTNIVDLDDVSLVFSAKLKDGTYSTFEYTIQEMLRRAKEGILPYLSFAEFKVTKSPILKVNGKKHKAFDPTSLPHIENV
jgi:hypothetical protein